MVQNSYNFVTLTYLECYLADDISTKAIWYSESITADTTADRILSSIWCCDWSDDCSWDWDLVYVSKSEGGEVKRICNNVSESYAQVWDFKVCI